MAIDTNRRSTLTVMALATGATLLPGFTTAACKSGVSENGVSEDALASTTIRGTGLIVSFGEKTNIDGSRQVIVTNTTDQPVTLSQVYPGIVSTPDGQYDLNSLLVNGSREFAARQATTLTIKVAQSDHQSDQLSNQLDQLGHPVRPADSIIHVRTTNTNVNGGKPVTTIRQVFS